MKVLELNNIEKIFFGFLDISKVLGISPESARVVAHRYIKNGILIRIKPNIFVLTEKWKYFSIENQVYIVSCNRVGKSEKYDFFGHSMIVDPWGEVIYEAPESEILKVVEIDLARVREARSKLNTLADVRPEIFKKLQS